MAGVDTSTFLTFSASDSVTANLSPYIATPTYAGCRPPVICTAQAVSMFPPVDSSVQSAQEATLRVGILLSRLIENRLANRGYSHGLCSGTQSPNAQNAFLVLRERGQDNMDTFEVTVLLYLTPTNLKFSLV